MPPRAREERLLVQAVGDELVVYDRERHRLHVLNRTAALVWRHCDGQRTMSDLVALVGSELGIAADESLVWIALTRLQRAHLLAEQVTAPASLANSSRRQVLQRAARVTAAALLIPTVTSIVAPRPVDAQSAPATTTTAAPSTTTSSTTTTSTTTPTTTTSAPTTTTTTAAPTTTTTTTQGPVGMAPPSEPV